VFVDINMIVGSKVCSFIGLIRASLLKQGLNHIADWFTGSCWKNMLLDKKHRKFDFILDR